MCERERERGGDTQGVRESETHARSQKDTVEVVKRESRSIQNRKSTRGKDSVNELAVLRTGLLLLSKRVNDTIIALYNANDLQCVAVCCSVI